METKVGYAMQRILGRVDWYVTFSGVQNMRHTNFSQVLHVLNSFAVTQNDAWINLVTVYSKCFSFFPVRSIVESWHHSMFASPSMHDWIYQFVTSSFFSHRR